MNFDTINGLVKDFATTNGYMGKPDNSAAIFIYRGIFSTTPAPTYNDGITIPPKDADAFMLNPGEVLPLKSDSGYVDSTLALIMEKLKVFSKLQGWGNVSYSLSRPGNPDSFVRVVDTMVPTSKIQTSGTKVDVGIPLEGYEVRIVGWTESKA